MRITNFINRIFGLRRNNVQENDGKNTSVKEQAEPQKYPNLSPLEKDTLSLSEQSGVENPIKSQIVPSKQNGKTSKKVKKSDFTGIDLAVVEKFRINISGFKTTDDLQLYASERVRKIAEKDFGGRQEETLVQRKAMLKEWIDYVTKENDAYTPVMQLAILDSITKDLKPNTDDIPPVLNKGVLADTMTDVLAKYKEKSKDYVNIGKLYQTKLNEFYYGTDEEGKSTSDYTGWIVIPSREHDEENFEANVDKLKTLSHKNWCTKSFNAQPYLRDGDFHVYLENGQPKLGVRFSKDKIQEIQGEMNNSRIPQKYLEFVKNYIKEENLKLSYYASEQIEKAEKLKETIDDLKEKIGEESIKNNDTEKILPYFGIEVEKDKDGMLTLSSYSYPDWAFDYEDLGIDENKMFSNVKHIKGDANFRYSKITDLKNLETIGGDVNFYNNKTIKSLGKLREIKGTADFNQTNLKSLENIEIVGGNLILTDSKFEDLGKLRTIGDSAYFKNTIFESTQNLESIEKNAHFEYSKIKKLPKLKSIGGFADFRCSSLADTGVLETIGESAYFSGCNDLKSLGNIKSIGGDLSTGFYIDDIGKLETIGGNADFSKRIQDLKNLRYIGGNADFGSIKNLGELEEIVGNADFSNTEIKNFGKIKRINGSANFKQAKIEDFGELRYIGGDVDLCYAKVGNFRDLEIGGNVKIEKPYDFEEKESPLLASLKKLKIGGEIVLVDKDKLL